MTETFKSFYKTVQGGEGEKCKYPTRLDTFGCGCSHDCSYCYAKRKKWFRLDYSIYALSNEGYEHLPLYQKQKIIKKVKIPSVSVCEDVKWHYNYWKNEYNPNPEDCCNLRRQNG